jgi:hypothetical protein
MAKTVVILQSNYLPWKGYFDLVNMADVFVFLDDVQYTRGDWRNRNRIKTPNGQAWLTVPCGSSIHRRICDVELNDSRWQRAHYDRIRQSYSAAPYLDELDDFLQDVFVRTTWHTLSSVNQYVIKRVAHEVLGSETVFQDSRSYPSELTSQDRVFDILERVGGVDEYLTGPSAESYLDPRAFERRGIRLSWMDYSGYPEYRQLHGPFVHEVSILDLLLNEGTDAPRYLKSFGR